MMVKKSVIHREELSFRLLRTALLSAAPCHCILFDAVSLWSLALADGSGGGSCQCDLRGALYF